MLAQLVAQLPELRLPVVVQTELKRHPRDVVVQRFDVGVRTQKFKTLTVRLPQELHPRRQNRAIGTILRILPGNGTNKNSR